MTSRKPTISECVVCSVLLALAAATIAGPGHAAPYEEGDFIEVTGTVTDPSGEPIPDIKVVFKVSRKSFAISKMERATRDEVQEMISTDPHGQFSFRWRWVEYYNRFEVIAGMPRRAAAGESFEVLVKQDLSSRIEKGSPVVVGLVIEDEEFLDSLRDFLDSVDSDDERRIYDEMGNPDQLRTTELPTHDEISWWYFKAGKAYRFKDGELIETVSFEPVSPFGP